MCALGLVRLTSGDLERAVASFEEARFQPGLDRESAVDLAVDLSAALLERSRARGAPEDVIRALAIADEATKARPTLEEAHFNRALALEKLYLSDEAVAAWRAYLALDGRSEWAEEARARLVLLEARAAPAASELVERLRDAAIHGDLARVREAVTSAPHVARTYAVEQAARRWAESVAAGNDSDASSHAAVIRSVGESLDATQADRFVRDLAVAVDRAASSESDPGRRRFLVAALTTHASARAAFNERDIASAARLFAEARTAYRRAGDEAGTLAADVDVAGCRMYQYRYDEARSLLEDCERRARARAYLDLCGRVCWRLAVIAMSQSEYVSAMRAQQRAVNEFARSGDPESEAFLHVLMSITCESVGASADAWMHRLKALGLLDRLGDPARRVLVDSQIAADVVRFGEPAVALYFQDRAITTAEARRVVADLPYAYLTRSRIHFRLGRHGECESDLARAKETLGALGDPSAFERTKSLMAAAEAEFASERDPARSAALASEALAHIERTEEPYFRIEFYRLRARALRALGDDEGAAADMTAAVNEVERQRTALPDASTRIGYFAEPQSAYDELAALAATRLGRSDQAFVATEMGRARTLLERVADSSQPRSLAAAPALARVVPVEEIQRSLGPTAALVEYNVTDEALLMWVITPERMEFRSVPARRREVERLALDFRLSLERGASVGEVAEFAAPLYSLLVDPVANLVAGSTRLVVVPDAELERIPFAALSDRDASRYLVEDFEIIQAPSASVFAICCRKAADDVDATRKAMLVIGNPRNTSGSFSSLAPLEYAQVEAERISSLVPGSVLLTGERATPAAVLAAARSCRVLHFAGHAVSSATFPGDAVLVLATEPGAPASGDAAVLRPEELVAGGAEAPKLVVLSACRTNDGPLTAGEGVLSFAKRTLAVGVPTVVASSWDVDDNGTARLFIAFHERYRATRDAVRALREAQLALLQDRAVEHQSPVIWGAFSVIGGFGRGDSDT